MDTKRGARIDKSTIARRLAEARERTRFLLARVSDGDLAKQHDPVMSLLIWYCGHVGNYEELWHLQKAQGRNLSARDLHDMYDAPPCTRARNARP